MGFNDLMASRDTALAKLQAKVQESKAGGKKDPREWKIPYDAQCNGTALIRFLPWGDGERLAYVEWSEFSFKGKGGNYWNRCLHDLGQDDPVAQLNSAHWDLAKELGEIGTDGKFKGKESDAVKKRGKRVYYKANIFVLEDNMNPANVGKVFIFKFGNQIKQKIDAKLVPEYEDQKAVNVFDFMNGANFRCRSKGKKWGRDTIPNYEDSQFMEPAPLHTEMTVLENIYNQMHDLSEFEAETNYKSYEELEKEMIKVLGQAEISRIRGESFDPAMAASAGANPFEQAGQSVAQRAAGGQPAADPFANAQAAGTNDPFAQAAQQPAGGSDPFAQVGGQGTGGQAADPFANAGQQPSGQAADPFANAGGHTAQHQADPFANAGGQGTADPFAQAGQATQQPTGQAADPFAQAAQQPTGGQAAEQQADPFANAGQADPFATSGAGQADPFASLNV